MKNSNCFFDVFNVSHLKGVTFLTRLRVGLSHLGAHIDIEILNQLFPHCQRSTNVRQNLLPKSESIIPNIFRNRH